MKCPNCGAETQNKICNYCGSEMPQEKSTINITNNYYSNNSQRYSEENNTHSGKNTWLWVLGWICIFPVPLTILMLRKKDMNPTIKYGVIAAAWILCFIIGMSDDSQNDNIVSGTTSYTQSAQTEPISVATTDNVHTTFSENVIVSTSATTTAVETVSEETTTITTYGYSETEKATGETTVKRNDLSQMDILINDMIEDDSRYYSENKCVNGNTLIWINRMPNSDYRCVAMYNIETKELKQLTDWTNETVTFISLNERVYIDYNNWNGYDITNLVLCYDMQGNKIFEEESYGGWLYLKDGRILCGTTLYDKNLENPVQLPTLTIDIGHGLTSECIARVACVYDNKAYVTYSYDYESFNKVINLDTFEISDVSEYDEVFCRSGGMVNSKYAIGNLGDQILTYKRVIVNLETREEYECEKLLGYLNGEYFFTKEAFYYVRDYVLYKYISEDESEIVYDGSRYNSHFDLVSDYYLIVSDELGTFLVDRNTGEETKIGYDTF